MDLAKNKEKHFHHGWFVVRNRTPSEADEGIGPVERDDREQHFFSAQPWKELPDERRGTQALKKYLADLLCTRIQQAFPKFLADIRTLLRSAVSDLKSTATARNTMEDKRSYLTKIAQEFEKRASQSIRGRYDSIAANDMKLRMKVREANDAFALEMRSNGHSVPFIGEPAEACASKSLSEGAGIEDGEEASWGSSNSIKSQFNQPKKSDGGLFASLNSVKVRPSCPGTASVPYQAPQNKEGQWTDCWQTTSCLDSYEEYFFGELRLSDYMQDMSTSSMPEQGINDLTQAKQPSNQNAFSQLTQPKQAATGVFGGGNTSTSGLSSTPTPAFGLGTLPSQPKPAATGVFGGGNMSSPGLFSTPTPAFGQPKQAATGIFSGGNTSSSAPLGTGTQASPFGALPSQQNQAASSNLSSRVKLPLPPPSNVSFRTKPMDQPSGIYQWIRDEIKASRGTELQGTLNPDVLPILFHKQARKWRELSEAHFLAIRSFTDKALTQVLHSVCTDPLTRQRIEPLIQHASQQSMDRGCFHLSSRMETILSKHLQTSNPAFEQKISEARRVRFHAALERYSSMQKSRTILPLTNGNILGKESGGIDDQLLVIDMRDTASLFAELHISNSQNLHDEVHDTLKAYYEIAREDFVEYVNHHIVEAYLDDSRGPVLFFDPLYVAGLSNQEIESLAAEDDTLVRSRASKQEALVRLSRAKEIAERYSG